MSRAIFDNPTDYSVKTNAWHCLNCGRMEDNEGRDCTRCYGKRIRVSRYEWFLADAIRKALWDEGIGDYEIIEQWPIDDHRGFTWHFDLMVFVPGSNFFGGHHELIEINGSTHETAGGEYRDMDKRWEVFSNARLHHQGYDFRTVPNDECQIRVVDETAKKIVAEILKRARA